MFSKVIVLCLDLILAALLRQRTDPDIFLHVKLNSSYDYIIVGAGSAGSVIANRLSEDKDVTVLLVEAGGSELEYDYIPIPLAAPLLQQTDIDWSFYTAPQQAAFKAMKEQKGYWPRGRVLGGSSSINYMIYVRGSRHDYDRWETEGVMEWSYKEVFPYFLKIEDMKIADLVNSAYHSIGGYLPLTKTKATSLSNIYQSAVEELGYKTVDVNGEDMIDLSLLVKKIRFRDPQPDSVPIIPCDGIPFVVVGRKLLECHQGIDRDGHRKEKRKIEKQQSGDHDFRRNRRLVQPTKKKNCPAKLRIRHVIKFPDFKVYS